MVFLVCGRNLVILVFAGARGCGLGCCTRFGGVLRYLFVFVPAEGLGF